MANRRSVFQIAVILLLFAGLAAIPGRAQAQHIRIVSPSPDTVVRPGQTITVSVIADTSFEKLALIGQHPLGVGMVVSEPAAGILARGQGELRPVRFQVAIPAQIRPGTYRLTAMGTMSGGEMESQAVTVDVERSDEPARIWIEPSAIASIHPGERIPVRVLGAFADSSQEELTKSSKTIFTSADPQVATVSADGLVTGVAAGKTSIQVRTAQRDYSIPVHVQ